MKKRTRIQVTQEIRDKKYLQNSKNNLSEKNQ